MIDIANEQANDPLLGGLKQYDHISKNYNFRGYNKFHTGYINAHLLAKELTNI
jgi:hypothetical protein